MSVAAPPTRPARPVPSRMPRTTMLGVFAGVLAGIMVLGVLAIVVRHPQAAPPNPCPPPGPCGNPPRGSPQPSPSPSSAPIPSAPSPGPTPSPSPPDLSGALLNGAIWPGTSLGFQFEYDDSRWRIAQQGPRFVKLTFKAPVDITLWVEAAPVAEADAQQLFHRRLGSLGRDILGLTLDTDSGRRILGPGVGYRPGVGGLYAGAINTPQGPGDPVVGLVMAASDGRISVAVSLVMPKFRDPNTEMFLFQETDRILNTFLWPSDPR